MEGPDPIGADGRRARSRRRVPAGAACAFCGEDDYRVLEVHHVEGKANGPGLTVVLCRNCHHLVTLGQFDLGVEFKVGRARHRLERLASGLRSRAAFQAEDERATMAHADELDALVRRLDRHFPGWREMPEE